MGGGRGGGLFEGTKGNSSPIIEKGTQDTIVHKYDDCNFEIEFVDGDGKQLML